MPNSITRTRYGQLVKPADRFSMMASHCPVPSPLSNLDVLGPSILPTTFSAALVTAEDGVGRVLKQPRDIWQICDWLKDHGHVQINGQKQPGCQALAPAPEVATRPPAQ